MNRVALAVATIISLSWGAIASADVAPAPRRSASRVSAPVTIRHGAIRGEDRAVQAKIVIPRYMLPADGEAFRGLKGAEPKAPAPGAAPAPTPAPKTESRSGSPPLGTAVAGIALSLAEYDALPGLLAVYHPQEEVEFLVLVYGDVRLANLINRDFPR